MRLLSNPDEDLLPPTDLMAARMSAAELPPFMRFSRSGSSPTGRFGERDDGLAQRDLDSSSIELEGGEESLVSVGVADVVGWGLRAWFLAEFINALCEGLLLAVRKQSWVPAAHRDVDAGLSSEETGLVCDRKRTSAALRSSIGLL